MVSAFITNVIPHHRWAAPHNPPTYVSARHRRRSGNRHKWKVLDMGRAFDDISLCGLKATRLHSCIYRYWIFPLCGLYLQLNSAAVLQVLISGLVTFSARQILTICYFLDLSSGNTIIMFHSGLGSHHLIRNTSSSIFASIRSLKCAFLQIEFKMDFKCCRCDSAVPLTVSVQQRAADCLLLTSESQGWNYGAWFGKCLLLRNALLCET